MVLPDDVKSWVRTVFDQCNSRVTAKLTNIPNAPEETFDLTWIEHFSQFASSVTLASNWTIKIETHYLGSLRHFRSWEIADLGVLVFIRRGGRIERSKVALLQSKRLYPTNNRVREEHRMDYEIGFARLADPEDLRRSIAVQADFEFSTESRYGALQAGSDQVRAIADYESISQFKVYYQLYNPWSVPLTQRIPLSAYPAPDGTPGLGIRVVPAGAVHDMLHQHVDGHRPTLAEVGPDAGWRLEDFAADELLECREGSVFDTIGDERIQSLFYRRSGPIAAAIAMTIDAPEEGAGAQ